MLSLVPLTATRGEGALYPRISAGGDTGLARTSYAMVDQLRSLDKRRVRRLLGQVSPKELDSVDEGVRLFLGL